MVDPFMEKPLPSFSCCSDTFWEENSSGIPASDLFHFIADIKSCPAVITLDKGTRYNFVSLDVVEKLQLETYQLAPYLLLTNDDKIRITLRTLVPLTINGHTEQIHCSVIPKAFTCCHLLLSAPLSKKFRFNFERYYPDILFLWNHKWHKRSHASLENIQEVLSTNVIMSTPSVVSCNVQVAFEEREPIVQPAPPPTHALEEPTIVPTIVSCDMQVTLEEREPSLVQPASPLEIDESVPTTSEEDVIDIGADLELQHANSKFCEPTTFIHDNSDLHDTHIKEPCADLPTTNFEHVVMITHKEVLAKIPPVNVVSSIMLDEPISVQCAMNRISEISYVNSSTYVPGFTFHLVGDYNMNEIFMVDHICITCDSIAEFNIVLPRLDCLQFAKSEHDFTHMFDLQQNLMNTYATDLDFTYICKLSCILHNRNNEHDSIIECNTFWSLLCSKY